MNPAVLLLLENLATTGASIYAQSKGASGDVKLIAALAPLATGIAGAFASTSAALQKAQDEGWTDQDPRWQAVFDEADKALEAAEAGLV